MEFISAEEFLSQPKEVQDRFKSWWEPAIADLFCYKYNTKSFAILFDDGNNIENYKYSEGDDNFYTFKKEVIPLFTEGQLRKFIEDKAECKLETEINNDHTYDIFIERFNNAYYEYKGEFKHLNTDLLKSYWKIACEIAKEY